MKRFTPVTTGLLISIAIVWGYEVLTQAYKSDSAMIHLGAIVPGLLARGEYWRLIAAMFLHGLWLHWFLNSWALYQLGTLFESLFGSARFAMVYFVTGICASIGSSIHMQQGYGVGASGAIFGILGALIFSIRRSPQYRHQPWTKNLVTQLVFWILVNIGIGLSLPFIDNTAHITGLITGLILGFIPHRVPPRPPRDMVIDLPSGPTQNQP